MHRQWQEREQKTILSILKLLNIAKSTIITMALIIKNSGIFLAFDLPFYDCILPTFYLMLHLSYY
jgi:hypothetical protein